MLSTNVKRYREKLGLGVSDLANIVGVTRAYINAIENETKVNPSQKVLDSIAKALGVTVAALYADEDVTVISSADMPDELKEVGVDYIALAKEFVEFGLSLDEVRSIVATVKAMKETNK